MKDMKMSGVFNLPLRVVDPVTTTRGAWPVISASVEGESIRGHIGRLEIKQGPYAGTDKYLDLELAEKMANGAANAINNHDRLQQENAELREALVLISLNSSFQANMPHEADLIENLLNKND